MGNLNLWHRWIRKDNHGKKGFQSSSSTKLIQMYWVSITQQCQVKLLVQNIQIQILGDKGRDKVNDVEEEELVRMLYDVLKNKKCFSF